jgi:hypothetical protein
MATIPGRTPAVTDYETVCVELQLELQSDPRLDAALMDAAVVRRLVDRAQQDRETYLRSKRASLVAELRALSVAGVVALSSVVLP